MADEVDLIDTGGEIGILAEKANWLLDQARDSTEEDPEQITIRNEHLLSDSVHLIIQEVLQEKCNTFKSNWLLHPHPVQVLRPAGAAALAVGPGPLLACWA